MRKGFRGCEAFKAATADHTAYHRTVFLLDMRLVVLAVGVNA